MSRPTSSQKYLALLRGINVGGKNVLPMKDLVEIFREAGCAAVRTFIQSGNVLFHAAAAVETKLSEDLSRRIEAKFGYRIPVVLRTEAEWAAAIAANPFLSSGVDEKTLHVYFLRENPSARCPTLSPFTTGKST
jgi:uncharacterized protein (DUF1697 family)